MQSPTVQHFPDTTAALALQAIFPPRYLTLYNGSGADISAGVPVDIDTSVTTDAKSYNIGAGAAIKKAAVGTSCIGAARTAIVNGTWGEVQVAGVQTGVAVGAIVAADDRLCVGAAGVLDVDTGTVKVARGVIANAALRTLNATPVSVIAAPGAGYYIDVKLCHWFLDYGTAAFDSAAAGDTLSLHHTNGSGAALVDAVAGNTIGGVSADYHTKVLAVPEVVVVANAAVVAALQAGEWYAAAGDSVLRYEIEYTVRALDFSANPTFNGPRPVVARAITAYAAGTATVLWQTIPIT